MQHMRRALILGLILAALCLGQTTMRIADGGTTSEALAASSGLGFCTPGAIIIKAGWTGGTSLTFLKSIDGVTYYPVKDQYGTAVTVTVAAATWVELSPGEWWTTRYLKIVSGTVSREETPIIVCR